MNNDRVAIVTGAAHGIGRAIAARLIQDGLAVWVADLDEQGSVETAHALATAAGTNVLAIRVDVSDPESTREMARRVIKRSGRIDVLVNNAGIAGKAAPLGEYPEPEWARVIATNLTGVFNCCRAVLPAMMERGSGRIVNIASIAGKEGNPNMCAYSASKAGVIGLTKSLGKELATRGILVNCVTPAVIETEILSQLTDEAVKYMVAKIPMSRVGQPAEVAELVAWLASDRCTFSTGAVFDISGGRATY
jgi:2-dehydro-3-deoxy-L-rhamnonate dehydrogenase (NAD+)